MLGYSYFLVTCNVNKNKLSKLHTSKIQKKSKWTKVTNEWQANMNEKWEQAA